MIKQHGLLKNNSTIANILWIFQILFANFLLNLQQGIELLNMGLSRAMNKSIHQSDGEE